MSRAAVRLLPLVCPRCATPVPAATDQVAWVCAQCGQGMLLSDEKGVTPLDVFFSAELKSGQTGRPFWVTPITVIPGRRDTYSGDRSAEMREFWAAPRLFFVAAWTLALEDLVKLGAEMLRHPVNISAGTPAPFQPITLAPGDVRPLAEFIVMSIEAERADALKTLSFDLELKAPQCWIIP